ncbi:MAG: hypothetical protein SF172_12045 [Burkholderiales bacterium]|nr:hypothetical protein [Burkholderiales bacterium]
MARPISFPFRLLAAALLAACATTTFPAAASAAIGRLANISVHDRTEGRTLPIHWHNGQAWVVGSPGNEYQVMVRNSAPVDVLAVVSVDGVNVITGETAAPSQTGYIIDPWRRMSINGWRKDTTRTAAFYFTSLADSYASRTGRPDNVGVIGVALFRRKIDPVAIMPVAPIAAPQSAPAPIVTASRSSEPVVLPSAPLRAPEAPLADAAPAKPAPAAPTAQAPARAESNSASARDQVIAEASAKREQSRLGTGHGRSEYSRITMVDFERATREPEEVLTIRYDSYANLVARGIIVARAPERFPNPFPNAPQGFVPDPPRY